jgi:hypothetical protein
MEAGEKVIKKYGTPLPDEVLDSIRKNRVALKGPVTTPIGYGFRSVNVTLRQALDLYCCLRPSKVLKGVKTRYENVDLVIVRGSSAIRGGRGQFPFSDGFPKYQHPIDPVLFQGREPAIDHAGRVAFPDREGKEVRHEGYWRE